MSNKRLFLVGSSVLGAIIIGLGAIQILSTEPDLGECSENDRALFRAVKEGSTKAILQALSSGADVNAKDRWGGTPLHWAVYYGFPHATKLLIEQGAEMQANAAATGSPLHWAAMFGKESVIHPLVKGGADVNCKDRSGDTPLNLACARPLDYWGNLPPQHFETIRTLLAYGADPYIQNKNGLDALRYLESNGLSHLAAELNKAAMQNHIMR